MRLTLASQAPHTRFTIGICLETAAVVRMNENPSHPEIWQKGRSNSNQASQMRVVEKFGPWAPAASFNSVEAVLVKASQQYYKQALACSLVRVSNSNQRFSN